MDSHHAAVVVISIRQVQYAAENDLQHERENLEKIYRTKAKWLKTVGENAFWLGATHQLMFRKGKMLGVRHLLAPAEPERGRHRAGRAPGRGPAQVVRLAPGSLSLAQLRDFERARAAARARSRVPRAHGRRRGDASRASWPKASPSTASTPASASSRRPTSPPTSSSCCSATSSCRTASASGALLPDAVVRLVHAAQGGEPRARLFGRAPGARRCDARAARRRGVSVHPVEGLGRRLGRPRAARAHVARRCSASARCAIAAQRMPAARGAGASPGLAPLDARRRRKAWRCSTARRSRRRSRCRAVRRRGRVRRRDRRRRACRSTRRWAATRRSTRASTRCAASRGRSTSPRPTARCSPAAASAPRT